MGLIKVRNRNNGVTGYKLADNGIRRQFMPGEVKEIDSKELEQLNVQPGGPYLLSNYLIIQDKKFLEELIGEVEPEYNYTEKEIKELLEKGSEDQLRDCLDFAPEGVKELVKQIAVDIKLNDMRKREIISDKFNFDINGAIKFKEEDEAGSEENSKNTRRSTPMTTESTNPQPARRIIIKKD